MSAQFIEKEVNLVVDKDNGTATQEVVAEFSEPITNANVCMKDLSVATSGTNALRNFKLTITDEAYDENLFKFIVEFKIRTSGANTGSAAVKFLVIGMS